MHLAGSRVVARIDERHRAFDDLKNRQIRRCAQLQRAELGNTPDGARRCGRCHAHDLFEREAHTDELAHHPRQVGHSRRIAGEDVDVGRNRVRSAALCDRRFRNRVVETPAAMADVKNDAAPLCGERRGQQLAVLHDVCRVAGDVRRARITMRQDVAGAQEVEDLRHERPIGHTADVAHHLRRNAGALARRNGRLSGSTPWRAMTFSLIRTLTPRTKSAFSATARAAASTCA